MQERFPNILQRCLEPGIDITKEPIPVIVRSAQSRHESRGLHFSRDYPKLAEMAEPTVLEPMTLYG